MFDTGYEAQARLVLQCLPEVNRYSCFALKGGTAINFFEWAKKTGQRVLDSNFIPETIGL